MQSSWLRNPDKICNNLHDCSFVHGVAGIGPIIPQNVVIAQPNQDWSADISGNRSCECSACFQDISPHILRLSRSVYFESHLYKEFYHVACVRPNDSISSRSSLRRFIKGLSSLSDANQNQIFDYLLKE